MSTTRARVRNVPTWRMTTTELARVWAAQHGVVARVGGWLYDGAGRPVCQGWDSLAGYLARRGVLVAGQGVNWRESDRQGAAMLLASTRQAAAEGRQAARGRR